MKYVFKPVTQLKQLYNDPVTGDCFRTCLAMLLGCESPDKVPNFVLTADANNSDWFIDANVWLAENYGLQLSAMAVKADSLDDLLGMLALNMPFTYYVLTGASETFKDTNHCVLGYGGKLLYDPAQSNLFISNPCHEDEFFWINILTPYIEGPTL